MCLISGELRGGQAQDIGDSVSWVDDSISLTLLWWPRCSSNHLGRSFVQRCCCLKPIRICPLCQIRETGVSNENRSHLKNAMAWPPTYSYSTRYRIITYIIGVIMRCCNERLRFRMFSLVYSTFVQGFGIFFSKHELRFDELRMHMRHSTQSTRAHQSQSRYSSGFVFLAPKWPRKGVHFETTEVSRVFSSKICFPKLRGSTPGVPNIWR